jgi:predicted dehydrogenase
METVPVPAGFDFDRWLGPAPLEPYTEDRTHYDFRWLLDYSGGIVTDWGAHHCDIGQWGLGTDGTGPVEFEGEGHFPARGLWNAADTFFFECRYADGVRMTVSSKLNPNAQGVRFEGDEGWVFVSRSKLDANPKSLLRSFIRHDELRLYRSPGHITNFLDCIRSRAETVTPPEVAHRSVSIAHLGNLAMRAGRKLRWNPETERFVDDAAADRLLSRAMREPWRL